MTLKETMEKSAIVVPLIYIVCSQRSIQNPAKHLRRNILRQ